MVGLINVDLARYTLIQMLRLENRTQYGESCFYEHGLTYTRPISYESSECSNVCKRMGDLRNQYKPTTCKLGALQGP